MNKTRAFSLLRSATLVGVASAALSGCAALLIGGAVGTALMVSDRRTSGVQIEDQAIELKALTRIREAVGNRGHISATSYNRTLLLTGEVASEADRTALEQTLSRIENLRSTVNELAVMGSSSMASRSSDTVITSRVKANFLDAKDLQANAIKVVTERGTVYLMGRLTEREATRATELARGISGVQKVVRVFEILTEAELTDLGSKKN